ncbi:hypothetical protein HYDPIDRAFT_35155 [Hydnomerulius pinastri MD-312]|uniref:Uncharacterized protein n=1 Tax=Hydnomerulius pinastri MD-312 TaxID=994086 RepID=A0A0C2PG09_9AGAM|nr:hypothetical protein HYDPIDRAFT_35155 [Hydnomerulius pinastri MD-312]
MSLGHLRGDGRAMMMMRQKGFWKLCATSGTLHAAGSLTVAAPVPTVLAAASLPYGTPAAPKGNSASGTNR